MASLRRRGGLVAVWAALALASFVISAPAGATVVLEPVTLEDGTEVVFEVSRAEVFAKGAEIVVPGPPQIYGMPYIVVPCSEPLEPVAFEWI